MDDGMLTVEDWDKIRTDPLALIDDERPAVRRLALARCGDMLAAEPSSRIRLALENALLSGETSHRATAAEALAHGGPDAAAALLAAADSESNPTVLEAVTTALGEIGDERAVPRLLELAVNPGESMVREAAVAALGSIGDPRAVEPLLDLVAAGPPQVRRRSVVALTVFDDPRIEPALHRATDDRNPMVREVAEMVVGHAREWESLELRDADG